MAEIFREIPEQFDSKVDVAAIHLTFEGTTLFLQRARSERKRWGAVAGKKELNETLEDAARRELMEETGFFCDCLVSLGALYVRKPRIDYTCHLFTAALDAMPNIVLSDEHLAYGWFSAEQVRKLPLMAGALDAFEAFNTQL